LCEARGRARQAGAVGSVGRREGVAREAGGRVGSGYWAAGGLGWLIRSVVDLLAGGEDTASPAGATSPAASAAPLRRVAQRVAGGAGSASGAGGGRRRAEESAVRVAAAAALLEMGEVDAEVAPPTPPRSFCRPWNPF
jgi:hypothetical protein